MLLCTYNEIYYNNYQPIWLGLQQLNFSSALSPHAVQDSIHMQTFKHNTNV
jgi:hypothetical protein